MANSTALAHPGSKTLASTVVELYEALDRLAEESIQLPHSLSFGDCQAGNLFLARGETVAIDWASVTSDPTGVEA